MAYGATVVPIMIASPGDVLEERNVARDIIHEWNYVHSSPSTKRILVPVGWETHSSPDLSGRPQQLINERVLDSCDLLVGIFWTKLGTPTGSAASGTAEEIERHVAAGKPAMVYFSIKPVAPDTIDTKQYSALKEFKRWCVSKGLIDTFQNIPEFQAKFTRQLQLILRDNQYLKGIFGLSETDNPLPISSRNEPQAHSILSNEALDLNKNVAADKSGIMMKLAYIGGQHIQTNGREFGDPRDRRSQARWEHAIEQLEGEQFITSDDPKRQVYKMTELGYRFVDSVGNDNSA